MYVQNAQKFKSVCANAQNKVSVILNYLLIIYFYYLFSNYFQFFTIYTEIDFTSISILCNI